MKDQAAIERAKNYPFAAPEGDFLFRDGEVLPYAETAGPCVPVIAFGSNAAPEHLARKFADMPGTAIAVREIELLDLDIVFSAHLTRYASIPATLAPSPGTVVRCHLTLVPEERIERMHESEMGRTLGATTNYSFGRLDEIRARRPDGGRVTDLHAYLCNHGVCGFEADPTALSARAGPRGAVLLPRANPRSWKRPASASPPNSASTSSSRQRSTTAANVPPGPRRSAPPPTLSRCPGSCRWCRKNS